MPSTALQSNAQDILYYTTKTGRADFIVHSPSFYFVVIQVLLVALLSSLAQDVLHVVYELRMLCSHIFLLPYIVLYAIELRLLVATCLHTRSPVENLRSVARLNVLPLTCAHRHTAVVSQFEHIRTVGLVCTSKLPRRFSLSGALPLGKRAPMRLPNEAIQSICEVSVVEV